jgi:hypothetical protein
MKYSQLSKKILFFAMIWSCITLAGPNNLAVAGDVLYSDLRMLSYDDMLTKVKARVIKAENVAGDDIEEAKKELYDALELIFTRPNGDNMVSQLVPIVRTPLRNLEAYESSVSEIAKNAIDALKEKKANKKATAIIRLENIMSELKPDVKNNKSIQDIFVKIESAKIEITNDIKSEFRLRGSMKPPASPSETAARVLKGAKVSDAK